MVAGVICQIKDTESEQLPERRGDASVQIVPPISALDRHDELRARFGYHPHRSSNIAARAQLTRSTAARADALSGANDDFLLGLGRHLRAASSAC